MSDASERRLVNALDACGWTTVRAPSSGSATDRDLPDVLAMRSREVRRHDVDMAPTEDGGLVWGLSEVVAIEEKERGGSNAYVGADEVEALERFAAEAGARALLAFKFKNPGVRAPHYLVEPEACRRTDTGKFAIAADEVSDLAVAEVWAATDAKDAEVEGELA